MLINNTTIVKDTDPSIRNKCEPVPVPLTAEDEETLLTMLQYVIDSQDDEKAEKYNLRASVGIAAPQIGQSKQMVAVVVHEEDDDGNTITYKHALANPRIVSASAKLAYLKSGEGCLSVEQDHPGYVPRSMRIKVEAYDAVAKRNVTIRATGYHAIVLQHEIDHLSGVLFYDHINVIDPFKAVAGAVEIE